MSASLSPQCSAASTALNRRSRQARSRSGARTSAAYCIEAQATIFTGTAQGFSSDNPILGGLTQRALQKALKKPNVRAHLQTEIQQSPGITALRACRRIAELVDQDENKVAALRAGYSGCADTSNLGAQEGTALFLQLYGNIRKI